MGQEVLVDDRLDDGQRIINRLRKDGFELSVAFWARPERGSWTLYLASPGLADRGWTEAARAYHDSVRKVPDLTILPWVDVQLIDDREPIARDALRIADRKGTGAPIRYRGSRLGDLGRARAYIYPRPAVPLRQEFHVDYTRRGGSNDWSVTTRKGKIHRGLKHQGVVASAQGPVHTREGPVGALITVLIEVDPALDEETIAAQPALSTMLADQARTLADAIFLRDHPEATIHPQETALSAV